MWIIILNSLKIFKFKYYKKGNKNGLLGGISLKGVLNA